MGYNGWSFAGPHVGWGGKADTCGKASATSSYHNGGVEGDALADWYDAHLAGFFDAKGASWGRGSGGTRGTGSGGTGGTGSGGTKGSGGTGGTGSGGTGGATETIRESFEWDLAPDANDPDPVEVYDDLSGGFTQNTGHVDVTFKVLSSTPGAVTEFWDPEQLTEGIVTDGAPADANSAMSSYLTQEDAGAVYEFSFSDAVSNVSFRINDVDVNSLVSVRAFDLDGNPVAVDLTSGALVELSDTDPVPGDDTGDSIGVDGPSNAAEASMLVGIGGPVSKIVIEHSQDGPDSSGIDVTDIYFDVTVADEDDDTCDGSGGTSGTRGSWWGSSGSGGTEGSGSGGTRGSGSGGTRGSGSGGTRGSGSGGTGGAGASGTRGSESGLPVFAGETDDGGEGDDEPSVHAGGSGGTRGGDDALPGPSLADIMALMTLAPSADDPWLTDPEEDPEACFDALA